MDVQILIQQYILGEDLQDMFWDSTKLTNLGESSFI